MYRLDFIVEMVPENGSVVEVGTLHGDFAKSIKLTRPDINVTCVDHWPGQFAKHKVSARAWQRWRCACGSVHCDRQHVHRSFNWDVS